MKAFILSHIRSRLLSYLALHCKYFSNSAMFSSIPSFFFSNSNAFDKTKLDQACQCSKVRTQVNFYLTIYYTDIIMFSQHTKHFKHQHIYLLTFYSCILTIVYVFRC